MVHGSAITASVTSTDSFRVRAQRSELQRVLVWIVVLFTFMVVFCIRRLAGGVVASNNSAFTATFLFYFLATAYQFIVLLVIRRMNRQQKLLPEFFWKIATFIDLIIPACALAILVKFSPRGAVTAISGPTLLLMPMAIFLSVLRLQP